MPVLPLVSLELIAGIIYLWPAMGLAGHSAGGTSLLWIITVGSILRLMMLPSTPILEDDYYRYLWDGGVVAAGENPYRYPPEDILAPSDYNAKVPPSLDRLALESGPILERINHPRLRTIYPPVAQAAFALAHLISPWSILSWRLILTILDMLTFGLLIMILHRIKRPLALSAVYWWNPLLIKEIYNSCHMDVIVLPLILLAVLLAARRRYSWSAATLALATAVKIWPVVLLPLLLRPVLRDRRQLATALLTFFLPLFLLFMPVLQAGMARASGFAAYGEYWEMNDALFMLFSWLVQPLTRAIGVTVGREGLVTRFMVSGLLVAWTIKITFREGALDLSELCRRALLVISALFLLSPTQFPWYYVWVAPFLAIYPRRSLLLLNILLPIYYLRFHFQVLGRVDTFDTGVVWLEYVPVWILLFLEWRSGRSTVGPQGPGGTA